MLIVRYTNADYWSGFCRCPEAAPSSGRFVPRNDAVATLNVLHFCVPPPLGTIRVQPRSSKISCPIICSVPWQPDINVHENETIMVCLSGVCWTYGSPFNWSLRARLSLSVCLMLSSVP